MSQSQKLVAFLVSITALILVVLYGSLSFTVWNLKIENNVFRIELEEFQKIINNFQSDQASFSLLNSLKRISQRASASESATEILADALTELIEKKLYTIVECDRDENNVTGDCSLKPGPKGEKGDSGKDGKEGHKGHYGFPGYKGEVRPQGLDG